MHLRDLDDEGTDQPVMFRFMGRTLSESIIRFSLLFYWKFYLVHFNPGQTISPVTNPNRKLICPKIKNTTHNVNSKPLYRFLFSI